MTENEIAKHIMDAAFRIHRTGGTMKKLVAAWRETFKPHVATLRRSVKNLSFTQRRNEKLKKDIND